MRIKCADGGEAFKIVPDIKKNFLALKLLIKGNPPTLLV